MTTEERLKIILGGLVIEKCALEAEIEKLRAEIEKMKGATPAEVQ